MAQVWAIATRDGLTATTITTRMASPAMSIFPDHGVSKSRGRFSKSRRLSQNVGAPEIVAISGGFPNTPSLFASLLRRPTAGYTCSVHGARSSLKQPPRFAQMECFLVVRPNTQQGPDEWWSLRLHLTGSIDSTTARSTGPATDDSVPVQSLVVSASTNGYATAQIQISPKDGEQVDISQTNLLLGTTTSVQRADSINDWFENYVGTGGVKPGRNTITISIISNSGLLPSQLSIEPDSSLSRRPDPPSDPIVVVRPVHHAVRIGDRVKLPLLLATHDQGLSNVTATVSVEGASAELTSSPSVAVPGQLAVLARGRGSSSVTALIRAPDRQDRVTRLGQLNVIAGSPPRQLVGRTTWLLCSASMAMLIGAFLLVSGRRRRRQASPSNA